MGQLGQWCRKGIVAVWIVALVLPAAGPAGMAQAAEAAVTAVTAAKPEAHWVEKELAPFKQLIVPARDQASSGGPITQEEWRSFQEDVLNGANFDKPIKAQNWATLMKLAVRLPKEQMDSAIKGYVYAFEREGQIRREDAVGGMVKLLSYSTLRAVWSQGEADPTGTIRDTPEVSEMQKGLFFIAYREGLLDAGVKDTFRPKDWLTNAEAVSMGYRVMEKFGAPTDRTGAQWPENHWSTREMQSFLRNEADLTRLARINKQFQPIPYEELDRPITPEAWHKLVVGIGQADSNIARNYTTDLNTGSTVDRSKAVVALMKLYGPSRDATQEEIDRTLNRFSDAGEAFDLSKLSIANSIQILQGDGQGKFYPTKALTVAEAYVLMARMANQLAKRDSF